MTALRNVSRNPNILDTDEVAAYLRVHRDTVVKYVRQRRIPSFLLLGHRWFDKGEIDAWMKAQPRDYDGAAARPVDFSTRKAS